MPLEDFCDAEVIPLVLPHNLEAGKYASLSLGRELSLYVESVGDSASCRPR